MSILIQSTRTTYVVLRWYLYESIITIVLNSKMNEKVLCSNDVTSRIH